MVCRVLALAGVAGLAIALTLVPVRAQQIHRHGFSNRQTAFVRGDTNLQVEVQEHDLSTQSFKSQPTSEHLKLVSEAGTGDAAFVHYFYETPPAPITEMLNASVWVKATRPGTQLRARVVFPRERDPNRPDDLLTSVLVGETYTDAKTWRKLTLADVPELLAKHLPVLRTRVGRDVNTQDAYIDRLMLNVYSGPGAVEVWIDDLDIGPVRPLPIPPGGRSPVPGTTTSIQPGKPFDRSGLNLKHRSVAIKAGQLLVDDKPFFFRAIRHSPGTPLYPLRMAGFNTVWFPPEASPTLILEAAREGFMVVPTLPTLPPGKLTDVSIQREAERFSTLFQKFLGGDSVLFWDLGNRFDSERIQTVEQMSTLVRGQPIPNRQIAADVWDDFQSYSLYLDAVSAHRWPLFTSLELNQYRDWLAQRRELTPTPKNLFYTWVQTHMPDWYVSLLTGRSDVDRFEDPIGPQPEQVRLLTYISLAVGSKGLGFWSDRFLSESHHGRDRLLGLALLNAELDMLSPLLNDTRVAESSKVEWIPTSDPNVQAAVLRRNEGVLVLPIWMGHGSQYVPPQGAIPQLAMILKLIPEGADPWLISPSGIKCLRSSTRKVPAGTELMVPEFDLVAPIVFTGDLSERGLVAQWQEYNRTHAKLAAQWSLDLAVEQYMKVLSVHQQLLGLGVDVKESETLLKESRRYYREGQKDFDAEVYDRAHLNASRALRPLRILMRDHWLRAVSSLSTATASPYATSFYSLPLHWKLAQEVRSGRVAPSELPGGTFETGGPVSKEGRRVGEEPGWAARMGAIRTDRVNMAAGVVPSTNPGIADRRIPRKHQEPIRSVFSSSRPITPADEGYVPPPPPLGSNTLKLEVRSRLETTKEGKRIENVPILERTFLAVDSPPVQLPPGTLVRVSAWLKVPQPIQGSPDGALFYDDAGGEPLSVRVPQTPTYPVKDRAPGEPATEGGWTHYHLYRRVPASGTISVTLALTGVGILYADDIRIEPIVTAPAVARDAGGVRQASFTEGPTWLAPAAGPVRTPDASTVPTVPRR